MLDLAYGASNPRLLTDDEFDALSTALAVDADDPDAAAADRLAVILTQHTTRYRVSDTPLRAQLRPTDRQRLIALTRRHSPDLLPAAHAVNVRWLTDAEVDTLADMLLNVMTASLDHMDEPSEEGDEADRLAGILQHHRLSWWE